MQIPFTFAAQKKKDMTADKNMYPTLHGVLFVALFTCAAFYLSKVEWIAYLSLSPLIIGIILGMLYGNTLKKGMPETWIPGIRFSAKKLLRLAIILYGFRLTFQHIVAVGPTAIVLDLTIIAGTFALGFLVAKLLRLDRELAALISCGSAICGAAAVLGMESVLNNKPHKTAIAVSTVVVFGTLAMFLYPVLYRNGCLNLTADQWGLYSGATIHEVAHVVGAGNGMNESIAETAIIVKMIRVIFLAPVLLIAVFLLTITRKKAPDAVSGTMKITIPWFAFGFIAVIGFNSLHLLPSVVVDGINYIDTFLLTMAMTALGMETHLSEFKKAGFKPFLLALILFVWLIGGGYMLVKLC